jgi:hypothetical protein
MSSFDHQWQRLTALARQARTEGDVTIPAGFATRVAARAGSLPAPTPWLFLERFALRGLVVAAVCSVAAVAFHFSSPSSDQSETYATDTVAELLDLS